MTGSIGLEDPWPEWMDWDRTARARVLTGSIGLEGPWSEWMDWDERLSGHIQLMRNREYQYRDKAEFCYCTYCGKKAT